MASIKLKIYLLSLILHGTVLCIGLEGVEKPIRKGSECVLKTFLTSETLFLVCAGISTKK